MKEKIKELIEELRGDKNYNMSLIIALETQEFNIDTILNDKQKYDVLKGKNEILNYTINRLVKILESRE